MSDSNKYDMGNYSAGASGTDIRSQTDQQVINQAEQFKGRAAQALRQEIDTPANRDLAYQQELHARAENLGPNVEKKAPIAVAGFDYSQLSHAEMVTLANDGVDSAALGAFGEDLQKAGKDLIAVRDTIARAISGSQSTWGGEAGNQSRVFLQQIGIQIGKTGQGIAFGGMQVMEHSQAVNMTKAKVGIASKTPMTEEKLGQLQQTAATSTNHDDQVAYQQAMTQFNTEENDRMIAADALKTNDNVLGGASALPNFAPVADNTKTGGGPGTVNGPTSVAHVVTRTVKNPGSTEKSSVTTIDPTPVKKSAPPVITAPIQTVPKNPIITTPISTTPVNTGGTGISSVGTVDSPLANATTGFNSNYTANGNLIGSPSALIESNGGLRQAPVSNLNMPGNALPGTQSIADPYGRDAQGRTLDRNGNVAGRSNSFANDPNRGPNGRPMSGSGANGQNGMPGGMSGKKGEKDAVHKRKWEIYEPLIKTPEAPKNYDENFPIENAIHRCGYRDFGKQGLSIEQQRELRRERGWTNADADDTDFMWFKPLTGTWRDFNWG